VINFEQIKNDRNHTYDTIIFGGFPYRIPTLASIGYNGKSILRYFYFYIKKNTKAITRKVFIISFETNPRLVVKFQTDRFRTYDENRADKKVKNSRRVSHYTTRSCYRQGRVNKFCCNAIL